MDLREAERVRHEGLRADVGNFRREGKDRSRPEDLDASRPRDLAAADEGRPRKVGQGRLAEEEATASAPPPSPAMAATRLGANAPPAETVIAVAP